MPTGAAVPGRGTASRRRVQCSQLPFGVLCTISAPVRRSWESLFSWVGQLLPPLPSCHGQVGNTLCSLAPGRVAGGESSSCQNLLPAGRWGDMGLARLSSAVVVLKALGMCPRVPTAKRLDAPRKHDPLSICSEEGGCWVLVPGDSPLRHCSITQLRWGLRLARDPSAMSWQDEVGLAASAWGCPKPPLAAEPTDPLGRVASRSAGSLQTSPLLAPGRASFAPQPSH